MEDNKPSNLEDIWSLNYHPQDSEEETADTITLTLEDDSTMECVVLTYLQVNDNIYAALLPIETPEEEGNVLLYRFIQHEDDDIELLTIDDDDEFDAVSDAFDEFMDTMDFEEVFDDSEE